MVPKINGSHIADIARAVAEAGAELYNIIPLIPCAKLAGQAAPTCLELDDARRAAAPYIELFLHCNHCRADAIGVPGKTEVSRQVYALFKKSAAFKENFSHG